MTPGTEVESNYASMNGGNNAPAGFGFTMKGLGLATPGGDQVYDFRGSPNSGSFAIPVAEPVTNPPFMKGQMTLTGNPYPSALDLK